MVDLLRDFWIRETGTGQKVTQLHDRYMMMMMMMMMMIFLNSDRVCTAHSVRQPTRVFVNKLQMPLIVVYSEAVFCRDGYLAVHDASVPAMHSVWHIDSFEE